MKKGTKFYSIIRGVCPKCQNTPLYKYSNPYNLFHTLDMHEKCANCNLKYNIEPSFFYGAMYISYALGVALSILVFGISYFLGYNLKESFISIVVCLVVLMPLIMRASRNIWLNMFVKYEPFAKKNNS